MLLVYFFIIFSLGLLAGWYGLKNRFQLQKNTLSFKLENTLQQLSSVQENLAQYKTQEIQWTNQLAKLETVNEHLNSQLQEQKTTANKVGENLTLQFKNLAQELLEEKSKKFTDQNKVQIENLLKPLGERIQIFEKQVEQSNKEGLERNVALRTEINKLYGLNIKITKEAENLAQAIKGNTKMQGNWGEFILESILTYSGLVKDREYQIQASFTTEDGKRYQPDVIVKLPSAQHLIIDAKVSLINYEQFFNAEQKETQEIHLKKHLLSIRKHINNLSQKNYQQEYSLQGLDFVMLFIPIEPAFSLVIQHDHNLIQEAYEKNILLVSPYTLIATLKTIASIWRQAHQNQNALEIAQQSGALYDKFVGFTEDLKNVGRQLDITQKSYTEAMKKLYDGKGNLIKRVENIKSLGARASKSIDQKLLDRAETNPTTLVE